MEGGVTEKRPRRKRTAQPLLASLNCPQSKDSLLTLEVRLDMSIILYTAAAVCRRASTGACHSPTPD